MVRPISRKAVAGFDQDMMELHNIFTRFLPVININDPVPLGFRLEKQLAELTGISNERATRFIRWYCSKDSYLQSILNKEHRFNFKGEIIDFITPEQKDKTQNTLNMRSK